MVRRPHRMFDKLSELLTRHSSMIRSLTIGLRAWLAAIVIACAQGSIKADSPREVKNSPLQLALSDDGSVHRDFRPLTDGPLHESFLSSPNNYSRIRVERTPPDPIDERPTYEYVASGAQWMAGYWDWDPRRKDFIWVTGTWRVPPPGRTWISGYWTQDPKGWYRVEGFWSDRPIGELVYRYNAIPIHAFVEEPGAASGPNDIYVPGGYELDDSRLVWQPGYWDKGRAGWAWVPKRWIYRPKGWVFQKGFWDRTLEDRGSLHLPVQVSMSARDAKTVYQVVSSTIVSHITYRFIYGSEGQPSSNYDGYPGYYYDSSGSRHLYAEYGRLFSPEGYAYGSIWPQRDVLTAQVLSVLALLPGESQGMVTSISKGDWAIALTQVDDLQKPRAQKLIQDGADEARAKTGIANFVKALCYCKLYALSKHRNCTFGSYLMLAESTAHRAQKDIEEVVRHQDSKGETFSVPTLKLRQILAEIYYSLGNDKAALNQLRCITYYRSQCDQRSRAAAHKRIAVIMFNREDYMRGSEELAEAYRLDHDPKIERSRGQFPIAYRNRESLRAGPFFDFASDQSLEDDWHAAFGPGLDSTIDGMSSAVEPMTSTRRGGTEGENDRVERTSLRRP
jgi:hypothetical protein